MLFWEGLCARACIVNQNWMMRIVHHSVMKPAASVRHKRKDTPMYSRFRLRTMLLLPAFLAFGGVSHADALANTPSSSTETISGGIICDTVADLKTALDNIANGDSTVPESCGILNNTARVTATPVEPYHNGPINGTIFKYVDTQSTQYGIREEPLQNTRFSI